MNLIVAVTQNWGIGKDGKLLKSLPEDMKFFRETTRDAVFLLGQKTLESFPGQKPLKGRTHIVLTDREDFSCPGAVCVHSLDEAFAELKKHDTERVFVIGGASVYKQLLPFCRTAYVTRMEICPEADAFFPDLHAAPGWLRISQSEEHLSEADGIAYRFLKYVNVRPHEMP